MNLFFVDNCGPNAGRQGDSCICLQNTVEETEGDAFNSKGCISIGSI